MAEAVVITSSSYLLAFPPSSLYLSVLHWSHGFTVSRNVVLATVCFRLLGGRFNALAPSDVSRLGAFYRKV